MAIPDPRSFYDETMPQKQGGDYEHARWRANPLLAAQYEMTADAVDRVVAPLARGAARVLEAGPGPGTWTKRLLAANAAAAYTLVDISREMIAQARRGLSGHANVTLVEGDFAALEPSEPFDFFFSSRAIEYMPDKEAAMRKVSELLRAGGRGALITKMPKPFFDRLRGRGLRSLHSAQIAPRALVRLLERSGLEVGAVRIATATVPLVGSASLNRWAYRILARLPFMFPLTLFAESYLVTFRKPGILVELFGLPGVGKSTRARGLEAGGEAVRVRIGSRTELLWRNALFFAHNPILSARLFFYVVRYAGSPALFYTKFANLFLEKNAKYQKARASRKTMVMDQGHFQNMLSLFERPMPEDALGRYARILPKPDELWICVASEEERRRRLAARGYGGGNELRAPEALAENFKTAEKILRTSAGLRIRTIEL